jgi:hypothetical protein
MKQLLWVMLLGLVWFIAIPLHAQETIRIASDTVHIDLPDTITFQLVAESDHLLEQAVLVYGTNGLTCQPGGSRQPVTFERANQIDIAWTWELKRSRALPPGAEVWWQWEITDAAGNRLLTAQQESVLLDTTHNWRSLSRDGVTVYWYEGNASFAEFVLQEAIESLDRLVEEIGVPRLEAVQLWVYDSPAAVRAAVVNVPEWTGGVAFPEYGVTVIATAPGQTEWTQRIIRHELAHLVVDARVFNCRGIRLPTWLSEGLSRYAERTDPSVELQPVRAALANGTLPPLRSLARGFSAYSNAASLSYSQSYAVVAFLIEAYGPERMDLLLATMQAGQPIEAALMTVYGFDTAGLDVAWRNAEGYPATPTSAADALALAATPTQVATLALGGVPVAQTTATPTAVPTLIPTADPTATPTRPTPLAETAVSPTPHAPTATPVADPPAPETAVTPRPWLFAGLGLVVLAALILMYGMTRRS